MGYSLATLCDNIGLTGSNRNLHYIYYNVSLNMWAKIRPFSPTVGIYKGITPNTITNKTAIPSLWNGLPSYNIPWACDFFTNISKRDLRAFYDETLDKAYNHHEYPPATVFNAYPYNADTGAPAQEVYNGATDSAGDGGYIHWIKCQLENLAHGTDTKVGIEEVINNGRFCLWMVPSNSSIPARTIYCDYIIADVNTQNDRGRTIIYNTEGQGLSEGDYAFYPYIENGAGGMYAFPSMNYTSVHIKDVAAVPYVPVSGVHWSPDPTNTGTVITYIDTTTTATGQVTAVIEGLNGSVPTHGRINVVSRDTSVVNVLGYTPGDQGEKGVVTSVVSIRGVAYGVAMINANAWDNNNSVNAQLKVYVGGRSLTLTPATMDLRISVSGNETLGEIIADARPSSELNSYSWSSADTSRVTIQSTQYVTIDGIRKSKCNIKGIKPNVPGTSTKVNCTAVEMTKSCNINVYNPVTGITITQRGTQQNPIQLEEGNTINLNANLTALSNNYSPSDAGISWWSPNTAVATVNSSGLVTAVAANTNPVDITATTSNSKWNDWTQYTAHCYIKVVAPAPAVIPIEAITILNDQHDVPSGKTISLPYTTQHYQLYSQVTPTNATNVVLSWSSRNEGVATIDNNGYVTVVSTSNSVIIDLFASGAAGSSASDYVTLNIGSAPTPTVSSIVFNPTSLALPLGTNGSVRVTALPAGSASVIMLSSSNDSVARVHPNGGSTSVASGNVATIYPVGSGNATITASAGGMSNTLNVVVGAQQLNISLSADEVSMEAGTRELTVTVTATEGATITCTSSNISYLTANYMSATRTLRLVAANVDREREVTVTVTASKDGYTSASATLIVYINPSNGNQNI